MQDEWLNLQCEYDDLLMKSDKTDQDERRIYEIHHAILMQFGPSVIDPTCGD